MMGGFNNEYISLHSKKVECIKKNIKALFLPK